jgi:hypothetical protein
LLTSYEQSILALLYNPIAVILHLIFRKGRKTHPAISMAADFLIWALCVPSIVFTIMAGMFWYWQPAIANPDGSIDCASFYNAFTQECDSEAYSIGRLQVAAIVCLGVVL